MSNQPPPPEWQPGQPPPWQQPTQTPAGQPPPPPPEWQPGAATPQVPWTPMPQQEPPKKRGFNPVPLIALIVIVGLIAGGYWLFRDRIGGDVTELRVGDCFDEPVTTGTTVSQVQHRPCNEPHDGEVFHLITDSTTGTYPARDHFRSLALEQCVPAATAYIGHDFESDRDLDVAYYYPTNSSWGSGDRGITCYLFRIDEAKMTRSVRGANPS